MVMANCRFRPVHFPPLLSGSPTSVGGLQITLQLLTSLNLFVYYSVNMDKIIQLIGYTSLQTFFTSYHNDLDLLYVGTSVT